MIPTTRKSTGSLKFSENNVMTVIQTKSKNHVNTWLTTASEFSGKEEQEGSVWPGVYALTRQQTTTYKLYEAAADAYPNRVKVVVRQ